MHGTIRIFLGVVPLAVGGFGNYLVPLQVGAADMAFPRLNMLSSWAYLAGGVVMLASFLTPSGLGVSGQALGVGGGGSPLLWQHLFWFPAHPEVYVLILPGMGIVAEVVANNTRKPLWGYRSMVGAAVFLGFMSMLVWAHHMFLTGMGTTCCLSWLWTTKT